MGNFGGVQNTGEAKVTEQIARYGFAATAVPEDNGVNATAEVETSAVTSFFSQGCAGLVKDSPASAAAPTVRCLQQIHERCGCAQFPSVMLRCASIGQIRHETYAAPAEAYLSESAE